MLIYGTKEKVGMRTIKTIKSRGVSIGSPIEILSQIRIFGNIGLDLRGYLIGKTTTTN